MSNQPQGPNWWQASDGHWYPPQQAAQGQPPYPAQPSGNSARTAAVVVGIVLVGIVGLIILAAVVILAVGSSTPNAYP